MVLQPLRRLRRKVIDVLRPTISLSRDGADPSLYDVTMRIAYSASSDSLLGRPYLIDFWGTWCAPCIKAMPSLDKAYERYSESGFENLSIALLDTPKDIQEFREDRFPMPWLHTLVEREHDPSVRATFEITGIPRPILVSSEGIILAIDEELDDDNLLDAVEAALSEDN